MLELRSPLEPPGDANHRRVHALLHSEGRDVGCLLNHHRVDRARVAGKVNGVDVRPARTIGGGGEVRPCALAQTSTTPRAHMDWLARSIMTERRKSDDWAAPGEGDGARAALIGALGYFDNS